MRELCENSRNKDFPFLKKAPNPTSKINYYFESLLFPKIKQVLNRYEFIDR